MKRNALLFVVAVLGLGACAPLTLYHRSGVSVSKMQADENACALKALAAVPVNTQIRQEPPRYIPGRRICDSAGNCTIRGGFYLPGDIYTVDVNKPLRRQTEVQCMAAKGYAPVSIPPCSAAVARLATPAVTTTLPALNEKSCVIRNSDGTWQIVTAG